MGCGCSTAIAPPAAGSGECGCGKSGCACESNSKGSCSCHDAKPKECKQPPVHPTRLDGLVLPGSSRDAERETPSLVVTPDSKFRCAPGFAELRPRGSFWSCLEYLVLMIGAPEDGGELEPPQALEVEEEPTGRTGLPSPRELFPQRVPPQVAVSGDGVARCEAGGARVPRFSTTSLCRGSAHALPGADPSDVTPASPDPRGKGGASVWDPCRCLCTCDRGSLFQPVGPPATGGSGKPVGPLVTVPPFGPLDPYDPGYPLPPTPPGAPRPLFLGAGAPPSPIRPPTPGRGPPPVDGIIVAGDAPAENVFEDAICPWCGNLRPATPGLAPSPGPTLSVGPVPGKLLAPPAHPSGHPAIGPGVAAAGVVGRKQERG